MAQTRSGAPRTLAISGELGSGVSYSYRLASHVAGQSKLCPDLLKVAPEGLIAFPIDLGNYISVEVERRRNQIAGDLLIGFRLRKPMEALAQDACNIHSLRTWLTAELSSSDKQWWVFVDSIDNLVSVQQGAVHELIHMLIDVANDPQVPLRVVLAGRMAKDFATEHAAGPQLDTAVGLLRGDVEDWFKKRGGEEGQAIDAQRLANVLSELFPAGGLPEPRTLAPQLPKRLLELLEPDDGS
jgi:hypothetical protein